VEVNKVPGVCLEVDLMVFANSLIVEGLGKGQNEGATK
jgi:hypothetical protein